MTRRIQKYKFANYTKLMAFFQRKKIENYGKLSSFLLEKFSEDYHEWVTILSDELVEKEIITKGNFTNWRNSMIEHGIIEWEGTFKRSSSGTFQSSRYKPGKSILKYINDEKSNHSVLATIRDLNRVRNESADDVASLKNELLSVKDDLKSVKSKVERLTDLILEALPPDTPARRKIVQENINDKGTCLKLLQAN